MTRVHALGLTATLILLIGLAGNGALRWHPAGISLPVSEPRVIVSSAQAPAVPSPARQLRPAIHLREPRAVAVSQDGRLLAIDGSAALIDAATTTDGDARLAPVTLGGGDSREGQWRRVLFGADGGAYGVLQESDQDVVRLVAITSDGRASARPLLRVVGGAGDRRSSRSVLGRILGGLDRNAPQVLRAERPTSTVLIVAQDAVIYAQTSSRLFRIQEGQVSMLTARGFLPVLQSGGAPLDPPTLLGTEDGRLPIVGRTRGGDLVIQVVAPDRPSWSVRMPTDEHQAPSAGASAGVDRMVLLFAGLLRVVERTATGRRVADLVPFAGSPSSNPEPSLSIAVRYHVEDRVIERVLVAGETWRLQAAAPATTDALRRPEAFPGGISPDGRWWAFARAGEVYRIHLPEALEEIWKAGARRYRTESLGRP